MLWCTGSSRRRSFRPLRCRETLVSRTAVRTAWTVWFNIYCRLLKTDTQNNFRRFIESLRKFIVRQTFLNIDMNHMMFRHDVETWYCNLNSAYLLSGCIYIPWIALKMYLHKGLRDLIMSHRREGVHLWKQYSTVWVNFCLLESAMLWRICAQSSCI